MRTANVHEAETQLSKLIDATVKGEEVVIARNGVAAVRLVPVDTVVEPRRPGRLKKGGRGVDPDWWKPDEGLADLFENGDPEHQDPLFR